MFSCISLWFWKYVRKLTCISPHKDYVECNSLTINELNSIISMTSLHIYIVNVIHKAYIPGMRNFQGFNRVVTAKVAHLIGFEKI